MIIPTLSVRQPWAGLIEQGKKTLETRSWYTSHRGPLLIAASSQRSTTPLARSHYHDDMPLGVAVAFVNVVGCRLGLKSDLRWALAPSEGLYVFELDDVHPSPRVPINGRLNVYRTAPSDTLLHAWLQYVERVLPSVPMTNDTTWAVRMPEKLRTRCIKAGNKAADTPADWARRVLDEAARKELGLKKTVLGDD